MEISRRNPSLGYNFNCISPTYSDFDTTSRRPYNDSNKINLFSPKMRPENWLNKGSLIPISWKKDVLKKSSSLLDPEEIKIWLSKIYERIFYGFWLFVKENSLKNLFLGIFEEILWMKHIYPCKNSQDSVFTTSFYKYLR